MFGLACPQIPHPRFAFTRSSRRFTVQSEGYPRKENMEDDPECSSLVKHVSADDRACTRLWVTFESGLRIFFSHHLELPARQVDDRIIGNVLSAVAAAIRAGQLQDPAGLPALVRVTARRFLDQDIPSRDACLSAAAVNPRPGLVSTTGARHVLTALPMVEREILTRYYGKREEPWQICAELHIPQNEFHTRTEKAKRMFLHLASKSQ